MCYEIEDEYESKAGDMFYYEIGEKYKIKAGDMFYEIEEKYESDVGDR